MVTIPPIYVIVVQSRPNKILFKLSGKYVKKEEFLKSFTFPSFLSLFSSRVGVQGNHELAEGKREPGMGITTNHNYVLAGLWG